MNEKQYYLTEKELIKLKNSLLITIGIPFIDDIEDYIVESIWEYVKDIEGIDPFYNIRSKKLFDVVDIKNKRGWSIKSLQWNFYKECEFELVIQRAAIYKKAKDLGFENLDSNSDPNIIGDALIKHWNLKINNDAIAQNVTDKRIMVLLKTEDKKKFAIFEENIKQYSSEDLFWEWTNNLKNGLKGYRKKDKMCVYKWYPSQTQFFERFILPKNTQIINISPIRLSKAQTVDILLPYLLKHQ